MADNDGNEEGDALPVGDETRAVLLTALPRINIKPRRKSFVGARGWSILFYGIGALTLAGLWLFREDLLAWKHERHEGRRAATAPPRVIVPVPPVTLPDAGPTKVARTRPGRRPHAQRRPAAAHRPSTPHRR